MSNKPATFIHGDRKVIMIDVPDENLDEFIVDLQRQLGAGLSQQALNQLIEELEKKKNG